MTLSVPLGMRFIILRVGCCLLAAGCTLLAGSTLALEC